MQSPAVPQSTPPSQHSKARLCSQLTPKVHKTAVSTTDSLMLEILHLMFPAISDTPVHEWQREEVYPS